MKQSKNWCFTEFNLEFDLEKIYNENDKITYLCWGVEICPKTNKKHLQGWLQFTSKKRMGGVKKILPTAHLEACKGTEEENDKYCKKDNDFKILGEFTAQGNRNDLKTIQQKIKNGMKIRELIEEHFDYYCRYKNGFDKYLEIWELQNVPKWRALKVIFVTGKTDSGKTRYCMEQEEEPFKIEGDNLKWWDGYNGEKSILIDEYNNDLKITKLLNYLDGYKLRLDIKGSFTYALWTTVYITSNLTIDELHSNARPRHREALMRRITEVIELPLVEL